ncbi:MAG: helix-turn-helix transcriptional regulator [Epulopiscium sp. Nele67-Bin005]|nr:MAG: helix-turn-helix transcriptional regulator [Epulopiscium sp. Nele67-Bin005]
MEQQNITKFFEEMAQYQISVKEFFSCELLNILERAFNLTNSIIFYFDTQGNFLSWKSKDTILLNSTSHPYYEFMENDIIRHVIYKEAIHNKLTYFDTDNKLYKSTKIINKIDYNHSSYVRFLEQNFDSKYSATMVFGINGYIQISTLKTKEQGDFTQIEMEELGMIYTYIANFYKNYKKYEQANIVSKLQSEIITLGNKAYFIIDEFKHVLGYNQVAYNYLKDIFGEFIPEEIDKTLYCEWIPLLFENCLVGGDNTKIKVVGEYLFTINVYNQTYSNGIVDKYYWITITKMNENSGTKPKIVFDNQILTPMEQKVARLIYKGLTYKDIADELVISYHTVKRHVQNIYTKCEVNSRFELSRWIQQHQ